MFDVIVDAEIVEVRERANQGNFDSMVYLATCIQKGIHTAKNPARALDIFNYLIARKKDLAFNETYWDALCQKSQIHAERQEHHIVDELSLEMVRHIVTTNPTEWDYRRLEGAVKWLRHRCQEQQNSSS